MLSLINNLHEKKHRDIGFEICTRFQPFFMHSILNRMLCSTVFLVALSMKGNEAQAMSEILKETCKLLSLKKKNVKSKLKVVLQNF